MLCITFVGRVSVRGVGVWECPGGAPTVRLRVFCRRFILEVPRSLNQQRFTKNLRECRIDLERFVILEFHHYY